MTVIEKCVLCCQHEQIHDLPVNIQSLGLSWVKNEIIFWYARSWPDDGRRLSYKFHVHEPGVANLECCVQFYTGGIMTPHFQFKALFAGIVIDPVLQHAYHVFMFPGVVPMFKPVGLQRPNDGKVYWEFDADNQPQYRHPPQV